jgi:hypothetical protein
MSTSIAIPDIFLTYSAHARSTAETVRRACLDAGLSVFSDLDVDARDSWVDSLREKLSDTRAVFVIVTGARDITSTMLVELGMALSWHKPVFALVDGVAVDELPDFLRTHKVLPISKLGEAIATVSKDDPFSSEERDALVHLYQELDIPADAIPQQSSTLHQLTSRFNQATQANRPPARLLQELLNLRKRGELPRISR